ncbi:hypothetical protein LTR04_006994, partial [Oleoguttula sp. CCFEE 6159]
TVYCLNRSADAEARQKHSFEERGAHINFTNVQFLQTKFGQDRFGLPEEKYSELKKNVDIFLHAAWAVDLDTGLESFEDIRIAGVRRCVDFSLASKHKAHIFFVSSIASVGIGLGYGESKHVASSILAASSVLATIIRAGQLAGPAATKGLWNKQEWLPSLVATSKAMAKIPRTIGNQDVVDWFPVDATARVLLDPMHARLRTRAAQPLDTYHLVNPRVVAWRDLVPSSPTTAGRGSRLWSSGSGSTS